MNRLLSKLPSEPKTLTGKTVMLSVANVISMAANLVTPFVLVRILSQKDYGIWGMFFLLISTTHGLISFNVSKSAGFFIPRKEMTPGQAIAGILVFNMAVGLAIFLIMWLWPAPLLWIFKSESIAALLPLAGLTLLIWNFSRAMAITPIALGQSAVSAAYIAVTDSVKSVFILLPTLFSHSLSVVIKGFFAWSCGRAILAGIYFFKVLKIRLTDFRWHSLKRMLDYSLPFGISSIVVTLSTKYHHFLVAHFFDEATFAIYRVGVFQLPFIILILEAALDVMTPEVARLQSKGDHEEVIRLSARVCVKLSALFLPVFLFMFIMTEEFITVFFTQNYLQSAPILRVSLFEIPLVLMVFDPITRAYEDMKYFQLKLYGGGLVLLMLIGMPVIKAFGPVGAVGLTLIIYFINKLITFHRLRGMLQIKWRHATHLKELKYLLRGCLCATAAAAAVKFGFPAFLAAGHHEYSPLLKFAALASSGIAFVAAYAFAVEGGIGISRLKQLTGLFKKEKPHVATAETFDQDAIELEPTSQSEQESPQ